MGYYNYLCELLRPLRVYRLDEGSLSGASCTPRARDWTPQLRRWRKQCVRVC